MAEEREPAAEDRPEAEKPRKGEAAETQGKKAPAEEAVES